MSDDLLPVETLDRLSRQDGVDVRPILVRVLTDLFVQKSHHSPQEIAQFEELVLQLLDVVDVNARAAVARKLADEPRAPRLLIERLLNDDFVVSAPILARHGEVPRDVLMSLAMDGGPVEAGAVATRDDIDGDMVRILSGHPDPLVLEKLASNPAAAPSAATLATLVGRATKEPALAAAILRRDDLDPGALSRLYLLATPERRSEIRAALAKKPHRAITRLSQSAEPIEAAIVEATNQPGCGHIISAALGDALGLKPDQAASLATEASGEPFALMLRAAGVDPDLASRALLIGHSVVAQSTARFFELVEIAESTPRPVALELVMALVGEDARTMGQARHEPLFDPSGAMERAGAARSAPRTRRPVARPETGRQRG